tara:strand:+ start:1187 stop:2398 length:1212 start_codon:yes stop_codon:yes gene_type:complete
MGLTTYNKEDALAKACKTLMLKEPFYGLFLLSLIKKWTNKVPTAAVSVNGMNYNLMINESFWEAMTDEHRIGILKHEVLHIGFFHMCNYSNYENKKVLNVAMDLEINQYIDSLYLPPKESKYYGCNLVDFQAEYPHLDLPEKAGAKHYYNELIKDKNLCNNCGPGNETMEVNDKQVNITDHDFENDLNEAETKMLEAQTGHIVQQVATQVEKSQGTVPGEFSEILERLRELKPAAFDWKGYMRRFVGKSTRTYTKKSRRKYNKRTPEYPGLKIKRQRHILAGIDTSGSVKGNELKEFLNELHHLKKTGADITLIQCDTSISHIGKFDPKKEIMIHGRGGTDFQPVIDHYNEHMNKYSCLMYFTDGEAWPPENAKGHILWVISSDGNVCDDLPGLVIEIEKNKE